MSHGFDEGTAYLSDFELRQAAKLVNRAMLDALPDPDKCRHAFSREFQDKMAPLLATARRMEAVRQWTRRGVAALLAVVIGLSTWLAADIDARAAFLNWVLEIYESSIVYHFFQGTPTAREGLAYYPTWLPEGYEQADVITAPMEKIVLYHQNQQEVSTLAFRYLLSSQDRQYELMLDESQYECTEVQVNGSPAHLYQPIDSSQTNNLIWFNEDETITFFLEGPLEPSVILHIAESVNLED